MNAEKSDTHEAGPGGWQSTRRDFLRASGLVVAGISVKGSSAYADGLQGKPVLRFGIIADPHYADAEPKGTRYYRESLPKMAECVARMNDEKVRFLVELGDIKDQATPPSEKSTLTYLETIEAVFAQFNGRRFHVLGNHDVDSISKKQFMDRVENTGIASGRTYYSFDAEGLHFVVLDANFQADGSEYDHGNFIWTDTHIPSEQIDWLKNDLASTSTPTIVFVHQQLDGNDRHCVKNAAEVRQVLQDAKCVLAVFQGHNHAGGYNQIENIHYYTLKAVVEGSGEDSNSYAIVDLYNDRSFAITGYRRATSLKSAIATKTKPAQSGGSGTMTTEGSES